MHAYLLGKDLITGMEAKELPYTRSLRYAWVHLHKDLERLRREKYKRDEENVKFIYLAVFVDGV